MAFVIGTGGTPIVEPGRSEADQGGVPSIGRLLCPACHICWNSFIPVGRTASTSRP